MIKNIAFFSTKPYDKKWFEELNKQESYNFKIKFLIPNLTMDTAILANGYDAVCIFVNAEVDKEVLRALDSYGIKLILLRCAGYNNVDMIEANKLGMVVLRVPSYSPEAVAEHAMTLVLSTNRRIHKAYSKVRNNDFTLTGLTGVNLFEKTAGIIGTGRIGAAMARICKGFGMEVVAYDVYQNPELKDIVKYVDLDELLVSSDLISLHCPLMPSTKHIINKDTIERMKDGVILVNTSRGGLIKTEDLVEGIRTEKFHAVGLDVFEEENDLVFEDHSDDILEHSTVARLLSFPNVILTSHQGFLTMEALQAIAETTLENIKDFESDGPLANKVR